MSATALATPEEPTKIAARAEPISAAIAPPLDMLYEVVDGEVKEKIMGLQESEIATILTVFLATFVNSNRLGKVLLEAIFRIDQSKDLQRRPHVAFVSRAKWPVNRRVPKVSVWDLVRDLAIEVVSPTNSAAEVLRKIHEYFSAGVSVVWVIYPDEKSIYIYSSAKKIRVLAVGDELDGGDLLPGFRLPVAALFEDDPE